MSEPTYSKSDHKYREFFAKHKKAVKIITIVGGLLTLVLLYFMFSQDLFRQPKAFEDFLRRYGPLAPLVFFLFSIVNSIYPIIPGGMANVVAYSFLGHWQSFLLAFSGNIIGSLILFQLARTFGMPLLMAFFDRCTIEKYRSYLDKGRQLEIFLAIVYLVPGLPDDLFTMLVGLTKISFKKVLIIQLLFKPITMYFYMSGMNDLFAFLSGMFH